MSQNPFEDRGDTLPDWVTDDPPAETPEAPEGETPPSESPGATSEPESPLVSEDSTTEVAEEATPEPALTEEQVKVWAGKYENPDELEKGYRELRDLQRRTAERARAEEQARLEYETRAQQLNARAQQLEEALRRAIPFVQQAVQQQSQFDQYGEPVRQPAPAPQQQPPLSPEMVDRMVQERVSVAAAQAQQQMEQQQLVQEAAANMDSFFERHPEVERGGNLDTDLASTILSLNEAWAPTETMVDISSELGLEIAYEATQRPALRQVLEMHPEYVDSEAGMVLARQRASEIDGQTQAPPQVPGQRQTLKPVANTPVVERGSSPAPPQGTPLDEFEQAVAEWRSERKQRGSDVFFGS